MFNNIFWFFNENRGGSSLDVIAEGYYSGFNSIIKCQDGDDCHIYCYGNGCYGMRLNCSSSSSCNTTCTGTANNNPCPIDINDTPLTLTNNELIYIINDILDILDTINEECDDILLDSFVYYSPNDNANGDIIQLANDSNICCRGARSCDDNSLDIILIDNDNDILCSGYQSCDATIILNKQNNNL